MWCRNGRTRTLLVAHGDVGVEQRGKGALLGQLGFGSQGVVPQRLDQHGGQVQRLQQGNGHRQEVSQELICSSGPLPRISVARVAVRRLYLLSVRVGVQARHQVKDVAERNGVQVLDERREEVVDVAAAVFQLEQRERIVYCFCEKLHLKRYFLQHLGVSPELQPKYSPRAAC